MKKLAHKLASFKNLLIGLKFFAKMQNQIDDAKILSANILTNQIAQRGCLDNIHDAEFKVFSQFGEDGILQYLVRETGIQHKEKIFIEFGVENYTESNTRFLLVNDNWTGLIIDGSADNIKQCKNSDIYWKHNLTAIDAFIDSKNINQIFINSGFTGEIGILSIDIDGNDYWVWDSITAVNPIIVVCEYNSVFGSESAITVPYNPAFIRTNAHYSNLYFGSSLKALEILAQRKGYALIGCTSVGNNAFFVRRDRLNNIPALNTDSAYVESLFRESRDPDGQLTYLSGSSRLDEIADKVVYDIEHQVEGLIKDLPFK